MPALIAWWNQDLHALLDGGSSRDIGDVGAGLLRRWAQPQRRYHTTRHLVEVFWALDELHGAGEIDEWETTIARLAGWFHDAVYDPGAEAGSNESASAILAREALPPLGIAAEDVERVAHLVLLSQAHETTEDATLSWAFQDADLWILSAPPGRFDTYCAQVRDEYSRVEDAAYRSGRLAILEPFLARDSIYRTAHARASWEQPARANLARELTRLRAGTA